MRAAVEFDRIKTVRQQALAALAPDGELVLPLTLAVSRPGWLSQIVA
jgi:hypothetical protein